MVYNVFILIENIIDLIAIFLFQEKLYISKFTFMPHVILIAFVFIVIASFIDLIDIFIFFNSMS